MKSFLSNLVANLQSLWLDGRTLGQKQRFIKKYYPGLYYHLYEEEPSK